MEDEDGRKGIPPNPLLRSTSTQEQEEEEDDDDD